MKTIITIFFILTSFVTLSQQKEIVDTNTMCFPTEVGKKILLDLNEFDRLKKEKVLTDKEIKQLELKCEEQDSIIVDLEEKDKNNQVIIGAANEKFKLVEEDNKNLRTDIVKIKTKSTIIEIIAGAILASITYIQIFK
jgi:hypothetical protein